MIPDDEKEDPPEGPGLELGRVYRVNYVQRDGSVRRGKHYLAVPSQDYSEDILVSYYDGVESTYRTPKKLVGSVEFEARDIDVLGLCAAWGIEIEQMDEFARKHFYKHLPDVSHRPRNTAKRSLWEVITYRYARGGVH